MSLDKIQELLDKQKLIEGMVHSQHMPRQEIVEMLVHKQHLVELEILMNRLPAHEIASILEALTLEDSQLLWQKVPNDRKNDILWEVSDLVREQLAGIEGTDISESQLTAYELVNGQLIRIPIRCRKDFDGIQPIWIDLVSASPAERVYVGNHFGLELPDPKETTDLEASSRFLVEENDDIHLHSNFLIDKNGNSRSIPVVFILHQGILFSLRDKELPAFRVQKQRAHIRSGCLIDNYDILLSLYGVDVEYSADSLENIYRTLSKVGKLVLSESMSDQEAATVLADIAEEENLNGQIRANILDNQRALVFLIQSEILSDKQNNHIKQILHNIDSLNSHTTFLFEKINFLMDATIGFININQNRRITQLTVFGVVFMPINILAGIGGMSEFSMMTKGIPWPIAYCAIIFFMILIGWGTYVSLKYAEYKKVKQAAKEKDRRIE